jgi:hypothetical protein
MRRTAGAAALLLAAAAVAAGARGIDTGGERDKVTPVNASKKKQKPRRQGPEVPSEIRGVHVTMALASIPGKMREYTSLLGLNTIELDVKDENGEVGFHRLAPPLARQVGAAKRYTTPRRSRLTSTGRAST